MANYMLLGRVELNASASSITFANIPQTGYTDLKIVMSARTARADVGDYSLISVNGSEGNAGKTLWGYGTTVTTDAVTNNVIIVPGNSATGATFSNNSIYIPNYTSSVSKTISIDSSSESDAVSSNGNSFGNIHWSSGSAITSVTLTGRFASFLQYSTFSLYGLAAVGATPAIMPKATGGNISNDGTYWYHAFLSSGTFTPLTSLSCDYLVVAGGGGGGGNSGGGGGAGGYRTGSSLSVTATNYQITIGAGGTGAAAEGNSGTSGSNSIFSTVTSTGGGFGAGYTAAGGSGGSGGGGNEVSSTAGGAGNTPSTSPSQGNNGAAGAANRGGGGGGASAAGSGKDGGNGNYNAISGGATTGLGQLSGGNYYFAGGGGAGNYGTAGIGGLGGGGTGAAATGAVQTAGTVNTGGGGGGGGDSARTGRAGGSGVVIIRYAMA